MPDANSSLQTVELYSRILGQGPPVVILHGVYGSGDNWNTFVKPLSETYSVHLVDLRNHGRSPHAEAFNYDMLAADVAHYMQSRSLGPSLVIGHSMGGKTAMWLALQHPELVKALVVVDIAPRAYPPHHEQEIAGMRAVQPATLASRAEADARMAAHVPEPGVRQFLLKNLGRTEAGGFEWKHNLEGIASNVAEVGVELPAEARVACPTLFVAGGNSRYISEQDEADIQRRFVNARVARIEGAGHWVQVEKPAELLQIIQEFVKTV